MALSPYRTTNVALRLSKPSEQWKLDLQELKILLLRRQYKQCATLSNELMKKLDENLHAIHRAYLQYYGAASYETLGRTAHNYSSNKLPLLNLAKDGYVACRISLADALEEFEKKELDGEGSTSGDEGEDTHAGFDPFEEEACLRPAPERPGSANRVSTVFNLTEPWRTYARHRGGITESATDSNEGNAFDLDHKSPDNNNATEAKDRSSDSASSQLMPLPLCIHKTRTRKAGLHGIMVSDRTLLPRPLFSPPPLSPRKTPEPRTPSRAPRPSPTTAATTPFTKFQSRIPRQAMASSIENSPTKLRRHRAAAQPTAKKPSTNAKASARMLSILTSLPVQLDTNISNLDTLISQTTELQRIHKATKSHRLASFWSFTPTLPGSQHGTAGDVATTASNRNSLSGMNAGNRVVSNGTETKQERMTRLRSEGWNTVGIKNPERGWKGSEHYETICSEALAELYGC